MSDLCDACIRRIVTQRFGNVDDRMSGLTTRPVVSFETFSNGSITSIVRRVVIALLGEVSCPELQSDKRIPLSPWKHDCSVCSKLPRDLID
jgi:hypothetical protein